MQQSIERITSLCTSLGQNTPNGYVPADDCQINLDELAFSLWRDDESQRNVSVQVHQLGIFKKDLIPLISSEDPLSFVALKALTAITYPPSPNTIDYDKHISILESYKSDASFHPELFVKALEFCSPIIENPRAETQMLNKAELSLTFIRNISIVPSPPDVHERIFKIFDDYLLFDVIDNLKISRFGDRSEKFARLIAGIFYGCFTPYLPFKNHEDRGKKSSSVLSAFLEEQKKKSTLPTARHGHWGGSATIKGHGKGYTVPLSVALSKKSNIPPGKHLTSRARPVEKSHVFIPFTERAEQVAAKMLASSIFPLVFEMAFPRSFSAYERNYNVLEQLQLVEMSRFFYEFSLKFGPELRVNPLASSKTIGYFQSMFTFWMEAPTMGIEGITAIQAMHKLCRMISSLCAFLVRIIENDKSKITDIQTACSAVSRYSAEIENFLVTFLCQKNLTKKSISVLKDNILALESLYKMYSVAQDNRLVRYKQSKRDEDADNADQNDKITESLSAFNSDDILAKLARRSGVLKPFFVVLSSPDDLDEEIVGAMSKMLKRFASKPYGLAHLFNLSYFNVIFRLWEDDKMKKYEELDNVFQEIIRKFFDSALADKTMFIQLIAGIDIDNIYDAEMEKMRKEREINEKLGIDQETLDILNEPTNDNNGEKGFVIPDHFNAFSTAPPRQSAQQPRPAPLRKPASPVIRRSSSPESLSPSPPPKNSKTYDHEDDDDDDDDDDGNMSLEELKKALNNKNNSQTNGNTPAPKANVLKDNENNSDEDMELEDE